MRRSGDGGWFLLLRGGKRRSVLISVLGIKKGISKVCLSLGRGDATRTRNRRFWRPLLYR